MQDIALMDRSWMQKAIAQARTAELDGEVPIGCVIVYQNRIIGCGYNRRETHQSALAHAELIAIQEACRTLGSWRLEDCTLYATLEPCPMCAGAIVQARIPRVVFGAADPKAGCAGTIMNVLEEDRFNHRCEVIRGVLEDECAELLTVFFRKLRAEKRIRKQRKREEENGMDGELD
ncbi:tRNA adenosine(34) deaminase TadA [Bacillus piscicola]|uniref:tRNA adenosine(34) deaminase TadA n=1 Tax=Bacillus piscicola TaxID=1632684 RepID=UPI001F09628F|nr:tRNA adenosine(34) deaminase TadA [Bacillus piscicola]